MTTTLQSRLHDLYFGETPAARRFRYGLIRFDLATVALRAYPENPDEGGV